MWLVVVYLSIVFPQFSSSQLPSNEASGYWLFLGILVTICRLLFKQTLNILDMLDVGLWILDCEYWIVDDRLWMLECGYWIVDIALWMLDCGYWIMDCCHWGSLNIIYYASD